MTSPLPPFLQDASSRPPSRRCHAPKSSHLQANPHSYSARRRSEAGYATPTLLDSISTLKHSGEEERLIAEGGGAGGGGGGAGTGGLIELQQFFCQQQQQGSRRPSFVGSTHYLQPNGPVYARGKTRIIILRKHYINCFIIQSLCDWQRLYNDAN